MKQVIFTLLLILISLNVLPSNTLAQITNHDRIPQAAMAKPEIRMAVKEPDFFTKMVRITDSQTANMKGSFPLLSKRQAWNIDESLMILKNGDDSVLLYDAQTYEFKKILMGVSGQDIFWHPTDPFSIIYNPGNALYSYNVITDEVKLIRSFSEYVIASSRGEGNLSDNGRYYAFIGETNKLQSLKLEHLVLYDLWMDKIVGQKTFLNRFADFSGISVSPKGNFIVVHYQTEMNTFFHAIEVYDQNFNVLWRDNLDIKHSDLAIDSNGMEVLVASRYKLETNATVIEKYRLIDGEMTTLLTLSPEFNASVSCRNAMRYGWSLISTYDNQARLTDSIDNWLPFEDEIFLLNMDGSQRVQRLAHHRSRRFSPTTPDAYNSIAQAEPQATISKNLDRVLFASNWRENVESMPSIDTYLVDTRSLTTILKDFRIELDRSKILTQAGNIADFSLEVKSFAAVKDVVDLDINISPNPENFRVFFTSSVVKGENIKVSIMVLNKTPMGKYLVHITGRSGQVIHNYGLMLQVGSVEQDFRIRLQPSSMTLRQGESFPVMIGIERFNGFSDEVMIWVADTKQLKIKAAPTVVTTIDAMAEITLKARNKTPLGTHLVRFLAKDSSGRIQMATMNLTVIE
ncbi:MAG: hypothetical protein IPK14_21200 [Blastocatellia bacterium]|nr:hypothetical protein [Blastocatellia bacterium]MBN8722074.1 hypothetical protein [Acidobacteriota bacterium]